MAGEIANEQTAAGRIPESHGPRVPLAPGSTQGIVGGGQLANVATHAARMGYRCHVLTPEENSPAAQVAETATIADYTDERALRLCRKLRRGYLRIREYPPPGARSARAGACPCAPGVEKFTHRPTCGKDFPTKIAKVPVATYRLVESARVGTGLAEDRASRRLENGPNGLPLLRRGQYDRPAHGRRGRRADGVGTGALERFIDKAINFEISIVLARFERRNQNLSAGGESAKTIFSIPPPISARISLGPRIQADRAARAIAKAWDYAKAMAVEMFVADGGELLINEIAPRPHNPDTGPSTLAAALVEQGVRPSAACRSAIPRPIPRPE